MRDRGRLWPWVVVGGAMALNAGLALHGLGTRPLSSDEAASVFYATRPHMAGIFGDGGNMALYYLLLRLVVEAFGASVTHDRWLSVASGVATIPIVYSLGTYVMRRRGAALAACIAAVSLPTVFWEQTARGYALEGLLVSVSMLAVLRLERAATRPTLWLYVLSTTLAVYTSLVAIVIAPLQLAASAVGTRWAAGSESDGRDGPGRRRLLAAEARAVATIGALVVPVVAVAVHHGGAQIAWIPRPGLESGWSTAVTLASGASANGAPTAIGYVAPFAVAFLVVAAAGLARLFRTSVPTAATPGATSMPAAATPGATSGPVKRAAVLFALWTVGPAGVAFAASQIGSTHYYLDRYFTLSLPAVALLIAAALDGISRRWLLALAGAIVVSLRFAPIPSAYGVPLDGATETSYLLSLARPGDCITFPPEDGTSPGLATDFAYFSRLRRELQRLPSPIFPGFTWTSALSGSFDIPDPPFRGIVDVASGCQRIWVTLGPGGEGDYIEGTRIIYFEFHGWKEGWHRLFRGIGFSVLV
ncbi:MAG TPA: hypothetical protein VGS21_07150, partial [Acidimicrobiales bacterium]|nr:hypothetical protein [Acidimicrobiales bacterium]